MTLVIVLIIIIELISFCRLFSIVSYCSGESNMIGLDIKQRIEVEFLAICVYLAGHSPFIPLSLASRFIGNTFDSLNLKMSQPGSCRGISLLVFGYWLYSNFKIVLLFEKRFRTTD